MLSSLRVGSPSKSLFVPHACRGAGRLRRALRMKITQVVCQILRIKNVQAKTASSQDAVIVRVRTDTGLEGIGEADASPEVVKAIVDAPFSHNIACGSRHQQRLTISEGRTK